jgi:hypothetical protein
MREAGLSGLITKKYKATTVRVPGVRVTDDLLDRDGLPVATEQERTLSRSVADA